MKMISKIECVGFDLCLKSAKRDLEICVNRMKGKYGTSWAVFNLERSIKFINQCISDDKYDIEFIQQFRNPPNTPKSRRLGWHNGRYVCEDCREEIEAEEEEGATDEQ